MVRTQISLEHELLRLARNRASDSGISLGEYLRRLVARDLACPESKVDIRCVFDLGASKGSQVAREKDTMVAQAYAATHHRA